MFDPLHLCLCCVWMYIQVSAQPIASKTETNAACTSIPKYTPTSSMINRTTEQFWNWWTSSQFKYQSNFWSEEQSSRQYKWILYATLCILQALHIDHWNISAVRFAAVSHIVFYLHLHIGQKGKLQFSLRTYTFPLQIWLETITPAPKLEDLGQGWNPTLK